MAGVLPLGPWGDALRTAWYSCTFKGSSPTWGSKANDKQVAQEEPPKGGVNLKRLKRATGPTSESHGTSCELSSGNIFIDSLPLYRSKG